MLALLFRVECERFLKRCTNPSDPEISLRLPNAALVPVPLCRLESHFWSLLPSISLDFLRIWESGSYGEGSFSRVPFIAIIVVALWLGAMHELP